MKLLFDGKRLLFAERAIPVSRDLTLLFPFEGTLLVNGTHRVVTEKGAIRLPLYRLTQGRNALLFRKEHRTIPVEGLIREGDDLHPSGFPLEETVRSLLSRLSCLEAQVAALQEKEAARTEAPTLFT